jgi:hypothetical protein
LNVGAVTVVARRAWLADALSRAAVVLGPVDGRALIRSTRNARGWFHFPPGVTTQPVADEDATVAPGPSEPVGEPEPINQEG